MGLLASILGDWKFIVALVVLVIGLLYHFTTMNFDYWKTRGVPEVSYPPIPFFGHMWKLMLGNRNFNEAFHDIYLDLGDKPFGGFMQSTTPALLLKDSEIIKHILVKDSNLFLDRAFHQDEDTDPLNGKGLFNLRGRKWKEMRSRISPTFTSGRMKAMFPLMTECGDELISTLRRETAKGDAIIEIKELTARFTIDVIASCAFGISGDAMKNPETSEFRKMGKLVFKTTWKRSLLLVLFLLSPKLLRYLKIQFTMEETAVFFRNFVKNVLEAREKAIEENEKLGSGAVKQFGDFIHHLVLLKKRGLHISKEDRDELKDEEGLLEGEELSWATVDLDDITAQVMIFFSAGFETSSSLLSFAIYELTVSEYGQKVQKDLRAEIRRVMEEDGGKLTYEGLKRMTLLDRVLCETLRLYPPAGILNRRNTKEYTLPGTKFTLEPLTPVFIPTQEIHRDPKLFPDPMRFNPDRFLPENKDELGHYLYLPFGDGPRHCIGQRFAELQARLGLACLVSQFDFGICREKTSVPIKFKPRAFILTAEGGLWFKVRPASE